MARKLYHFTTVMAVLALASGLWLWLGFGFAGGWIHAKLAMVVLLIGYHLSTRVLMRRMQRDAALPGSTALRWYNELPLVILIVILWLVVLKPF
jgi:putative membrane protein